MNLTTKEIDCVLRSLTIFAYVSRHTKRNPVKKMPPPTGRGISRGGCRRVLPLRRLVGYHVRKNTTESLSFPLTRGEAMPSPKQRGSTSLTPIGNQQTSRNDGLKQIFQNHIFSFKVKGERKELKRKEKSSSTGREGEMGSYLWATRKLVVSSLAGPRALESFPEERIPSSSVKTKK